MEKELRLLVGKINESVRELDYVWQVKKVGVSKGKKGEQEWDRLKSNYVKRKVICVKGGVNKKVDGSYIVGEFNFIRGEEKESFEESFRELCEKEVEDIVEVEGVLKEWSLEMVEIKEMGREIRKV